MNQKSLFLIFLIFFLLFTPTVKSQGRLGTIVMIDDSLMSHLHLERYVLVNPNIQYSLPFELEDYGSRMVDSLFVLNKQKVELVPLNRELFIEYLSKKGKYTGNGFNKIRKKWFEQIVEENDLDALIVITNTDLNIKYGMEATHIETEKICVTTCFNGKRPVLQIRMKMNVFLKSNPKKYKAKSWGDELTGFEKISEIEVFSEEQLKRFEIPLQEMIMAQLIEIKTSKDYKDMLSELRRKEALRKYYENNKK